MQCIFSSLNKVREERDVTYWASALAGRLVELGGKNKLWVEASGSRETSGSCQRAIGMEDMTRGPWLQK